MIATVLDSGKDSIKTVLKTMSNMTGLSASSSQVAYSGSSSLDTELPMDVNYHVLEQLGIVVLNDTQVDSVAARGVTPQDHNVVMEQEQWNYPLGFETQFALSEDKPKFSRSLVGNSGATEDYLLGMRHAIDLILEQQKSSRTHDIPELNQFPTNTETTWGLQATGVASSMFSGKGVRIGVLDSGFDRGHPDFTGRNITQASFIPGSEPDNDELDRSGHGTHCIGTSCGARNPGVGPRYGVAHEAEIFSGKVLRQGSNGRASGADGWILAGIDWAMRNECQIISMSLGSTATSSTFPMSYERAAQRGLTNGILIFAATGNESDRANGFIAPVGRPANCPSIAAVAALDIRNVVANFSNGQKFGNGGEVNFVGPGVEVLSSVPMPKRRAVFDGTSMATPHAAGIAALICEETGLTGIDLYLEMKNRALNLGNPTDFGHGLVRAQASFV